MIIRDSDLLFGQRDTHCAPKNVPF